MIIPHINIIFLNGKNQEKAVYILLRLTFSTSFFDLKNGKQWYFCSRGCPIFIYLEEIKRFISFHSFVFGFLSEI